MNGPAGKPRLLAPLTIQTQDFGRRPNADILRGKRRKHAEPDEATERPFRGTADYYCRSASE